MGSAICMFVSKTSKPNLQSGLYIDNKAMLEVIYTVVLLSNLVSACSQWKTVFFDDFLGHVLDPSLWDVANNFTHCEPCEDANYLYQNPIMSHVIYHI